VSKQILLHGVNRVLLVVRLADGICPSCMHVDTDLVHDDVC